MSRWTVGALLLLLSACACRAPAPQLADYCVVVAAMNPDADRLNRLMDAFATSRGLKIDISPTTQSYTDAAGPTEISVDRMGPLGAVITLFNPADGPSAHQAPLKEYVDRVVAGRWTVRRCQDVEGFKGPWNYR